ncbi:MAG: hypothetical protein OXI81_12235 [Paracoccaceae bacterium]|nr:hypothetical protein [Paracoccaceae bacterium]MDE2912592.1 hypothetical protein [Paracoccaceae bacterium]
MAAPTGQNTVIDLPKFSSNPGHMPRNGSKVVQNLVNALLEIGTYANLARAAVSPRLLELAGFGSVDKLGVKQWKSNLLN